MRGNGQRLESGGGEPLTNIAAQIKLKEGHRRAYHFRSWPTSSDANVAFCSFDSSRPTFKRATATNLVN